MALMREGIGVYKALRAELKDMVPFFPLGFGRVNDHQLAYGVRSNRKAYLSVFTIGSREAEIPLACLGEVRGVKVIYPGTGDCDIALEQNVLRVTMPGDTCARLFEITLA